MDNDERNARETEMLLDAQDRQKAENEKALENGITKLLRGTRLLTFSEKAVVAERALRGFGFQARVIG